MARVAEFGVWFVVFLFSTTLHEAGHALFAWLGGDDTAYHGGQVTLNPLPHVRREPFGMVLVPILVFAFSSGRWMMGWASTPYDPHWAQRHPRRQALMSAAGFGANLLLVIVSFALLWVLLARGVLVMPPEHASFNQLAVAAPSYGPDSYWHPIATFLSVALSLNLLLFVFNLLPIPPLDGSGVIHGLFPDTLGVFIERFSRTPMMGFVGLLIAWQVFPYLFRPALRGVLGLLYPGHF